MMLALRRSVLILFYGILSGALEGALPLSPSFACESEADGEVSGCPSEDISVINDVSLLQVARSMRTETGPVMETRTSLWDGMDRVGGDQSTQNFDGQHYLPWKTHANEELLILGPFDSGTNLMKEQLSSTYPHLMHNVCTEYQFIPGRCGLVWKHGVEHRYTFSEITANVSNLRVIIMVRSPFSLLASWKKAPYDLEHCMNTTWSQMANDTCTAPMAWLAKGWHWPKIPVEQLMDWPKIPVEQLMASAEEEELMQFHGVMDIYNHYMRQYNNITHHSGIVTQMVAYEDLVYSPEIVLQAVAKRFGWPIRNNITIFEDRAKNHGDAVGREDALAKLRSRAFLAEFTEEEKQLLCTGLDEAPIQGITEGTYLGHPRPYSMDCHNT